jgi:methylenetetrahydrofolate reductase (NADPH)
MTQAGLRLAARALEAARYEVIPTASIEDKVLEHVPAGFTVTVTASPTKGLEATLGLAERLSLHGYAAVPHVSARLVRDRSHLSEIVARLAEHGISDVFVPAGDADPPAGVFDSALSLLLALDSLGHPFRRVGITGYPQTHPLIHDDITIQAMWDKRRYATYIISNMCFDAAALKRWIGRVRARGVTLPLRVGLAGPVDRAKLLTMASKIGVADSSRYLRSHSSWAVRLGAPGGYSPTRLLERLGPILTAGPAAVEGLHVFTFNQVGETEAWRKQLLAHIAGSSGSRRSVRAAAGGAPGEPELGSA